MSLTFNPATSVFSAGKGPKNLACPVSGGPLTPKSHDSYGNINRPVPLRSRFFHAEDIIRPEKYSTFKPWLVDDKENYVFSDKEKNPGKTFGKVFGVFEKNSDGKTDVEKRCLRCYDKATFVLEPCRHTYVHSSSIF